MRILAYANALGILGGWVFHPAKVPSPTPPTGWEGLNPERPPCRFRKAEHVEIVRGSLSPSPLWGRVGAGSLQAYETAPTLDKESDETTLSTPSNNDVRAQLHHTVGRQAEVVGGIGGSVGERDVEAVLPVGHAGLRIRHQLAAAEIEGGRHDVEL